MLLLLHSFYYEEKEKEKEKKDRICGCQANLFLFLWKLEYIGKVKSPLVQENKNLFT